MTDRSTGRAGAKSGALFPITLMMTLAVIVLPGSIPGPAAPATLPATPANKSVLLLFPYQIDMPVSEIGVAALREELGKATDLRFDLYFEFMDLNRFSDPVYKQRYLALLATKFLRRQIDLVIVQGETALGIWLENRNGIAPFAPVVFYDFNLGTTTLESRRFPPDVRGINAVIDYAPSVRWILETWPSIDEVVIVHGSGKADEEFLRDIGALVRDMKGSVLFTDISKLPFGEIKERTGKLERDSAVLYGLMFEDATGKKFRPRDALRELAAAAAVPVLSGYDQFIGTGTVGGFMYSIAQQARDAARMGADILRGEPVEPKATSMEYGNRFIFDHPALKRFGIPLSALPPDSIVMNREYSSWELYRFQIIAIMLVFTILVGLVAALSAKTRSLRASRAALDQVNAGLETQVRERTVKLEASLGENERLLGELQHRAKNSFAMICSLIGLSSSADTAPETQSALDKLERRVRSISELYALLYSSGSFTEIRLDEYCGHVVSAMTDLSPQTSMRTDMESIVVPIRIATPIGLMLTEFVTNAVKYGHPQDMEGEIAVTLKRTPGGAALEVRDNGPGLPEGFSESPASSSGLMLVRGLAAQIGGSLDLANNASGTRCVVSFPLT